MNLGHAFNVALLMLPERFKEVDLYSTISGISYSGDLRMGIGEHPRKVQNIVSGSFSHFRETYMEQFKMAAQTGRCFYSVGREDKLEFEQNKTLESISQSLIKLPVSLRKRMHLLLTGTHKSLNDTLRTSISVLSDSFR